MDSKTVEYFVNNEGLVDIILGDNIYNGYTNIQLNIQDVEVRDTLIKALKAAKDNKRVTSALLSNYWNINDVYSLNGSGRNARAGAVASRNDEKTIINDDGPSSLSTATIGKSSDRLVITEAALSSPSSEIHSP